MKQKERQYQEKYGEVPKEFYERFIYLINTLKLAKKNIDELKSTIAKYLSNIEWMDIKFIFYSLPEACPRPRYSRFTGTFYVKGAKTDFEYFKNYYKKNEMDTDVIITTPCKFYCDIFVPIPEGMNKTEKLLSELKLIRPISAPDWDNAGKKYSDMIQSELILNDCLIIDGCVRKFYSMKPRVEISIAYMTQYDCKFNKKKVEQWKTYKNKLISEPGVMNEKTHLMM